MKNKPIRRLTPEEMAYAKSHIRHESSYKTICQLIRDVFIESERINNLAIRSNALYIYAYAKRMNSALRNKNGAYDAGWWATNGKEDRESNIKEETVPFTTA